ncbi:MULTISPECIES: NmrA family NAD(P)-binding protein [unclassified Streptomyces]|uniref:NmrA family NAD(P)-binding protein n=1 Tax=unclassified Streptomyces TaxID=2593676 RepID=UPI002DDC41EB|nr:MULTISPECIES: NmrA family NAD(P)-binding protein [unclassified Streptomyces]WSF82325.1 NmrA family NAD(P)-binding protein [Streptomyces sp. NBC_01744]WSC41382.1 NmrA family NAD(P)-binding protein [Streptomyces sp. NBC_01763]WSC49769.1 NmrA family NAD(P)-binding protein [Streptomyces sp. NBC_01762]WSC51473.1 NmrA family NAD(P)-binding protein [Streptomyces sp. NBC_01761]WSD29346.1 NmrA family NAD(P)-binding protein [Streptomyces sp. NBC_01751]
MGNTDTPRVLILGATGRTGAAVVKTLEATPDQAVPVLASRSKATVEQWIKEGKEAVRIDLDDPDTFPGALEGIDRAFLMTGYTSAMNHQAKALVDAAEDAEVGFLVHLGVFSDGRSTDPHFAWHELVERYIAGSKLAWAHVHPHVFMENLLGINRLRDGRMVWPMGNKRVGWIAGDDIAAVVGKILIEGPEAHASKDYFLSTDLLDGAEVAEVLSAALGHEIPAVILTPDDLQRLIDAGLDTAPANMDAAYAASTLIWARQTYEGRMDYSAVTTSTVQDLLGREPIHLASWATTHRQELLDQLP